MPRWEREFSIVRVGWHPETQPFFAGCPKEMEVARVWAATPGQAVEAAYGFCRCLDNQYLKAKEVDCGQLRRVS